MGQTQKGFRTQVIDGSGNTTWRYDLLGRLLVETKTITGAPASYTTQFGYNQLNQMTSMVYPDGESITTNYNSQRLPESMTTYVTSAAYEASDQMKQVTFGNGIATTYTYNPLTQQLETLKAGPTNNLQNYSYTYDNVGNVKTINDPLRGQVATYNYDDLNRLESASIPNVYSHSWTYTPIGNLFTRNDNNGNVTYQYNDASHKHAVSQIGSQYFCYDANGNMTKRASANSACSSGGDTLQYDNENKLTSITVGGTTTTYAYDADGARVKKVAGGTTTYYVGNHYEVTNNVATKYYYFGSKRVAMKVGTTVTYLHGDHLGSTSATTNSAGTSTSSQVYYAFGNVRATTGTVPTDFTFTGQKRDANAGLMYYNARYYDTTLGRFISADSIVPKPGNPQTLNRYAYGYNNPLRYTDPTGRDGPDIVNLFGEFITGVANEWWYNNAWFLPQREGLKVQYDESDAMIVGRVVGDVLSMAQSVVEVDAGAGIAGGGVLACATGVGCVAGAPAIVVGGAAILHGAGTGINGAIGAGNNLGNLISRASSNKPIPAIEPPTWRGGLRNRMEKAGIKPPAGMQNPQVHHNLPWTFREWFAGRLRGLYVNDTRFGRWVSGAPPGPHQGWTQAYEQEWRQFIGRNPDATRQQVLDFLDELLISGRFPSQ